MKKTIKLILVAFALTAFTACGNQDGTTTDQTETGVETAEGVNSDIEADTAITLDPDTTIYHDMTQ